MSNNPLAETSFKVQKKGSSEKHSVLSRALPPGIRRSLRFGYLLGLDALDVCLGKRKELMPPRRLNFVGDGDFEQTGNEFLNYFIRFGGLQPSHSVLEVGCGIGRMARPLTKYLESGSYEGIDIVPVGIRWCQKNITPRYSNFHFALADIFNTEYNPTGQLKAWEYRFPFENDSFDFSFLTSVFTHLLTKDADHYLAELSRVLRPGGKCLATFFLLNDDSSKAVDDGTSSLLFRYAVDDCWTTNPEIPEAAIAFKENTIRELLKKHGLEVNSIHYGKWCGRSSYLSYQDVLVLRKGSSTG